METTEWFNLITGNFGYPQPEDNFGYLNSTYDLTGVCPTCSKGLKQVNEFHFKSELKSKHSYFIGLNWVFDQIFIRPAVREVFEAQNVTGIYYSTPIHHKTNKPLETIQQLHIDTLVKNGLATEKYETEICEYPRKESSIKFLAAMGGKLLNGPFCGQIKYHHLPYRQFIFRENSFQNMPDFVRTEEWFGSGASAAQPIFVSKKVRDIIKKEKWRGAFLEPITFT